ncbi:response regulator [Candidatus Dependentiae bacterium]|nr:response regulator [Candidatus Dependentiae bacterium]
MSKKVLIIEDDVDYIEVLKKRLVSQDFELFFATKGFDAVDIIINNPPDVIILDLNLPYIDGDAVISAFKSRNLAKNIPIIINSARPEEDIKKAMEKVGAKTFIKKPTDFTKLIEIIKSI